MKSLRVVLASVCAAVVLRSDRVVAVDVDYCGSIGECASGGACRTQPLGHVCGENMGCIFDNARCSADTIRCFCTRGGVLFEEFAQPLLIDDNNPADLTVAMDVPPDAAGVVLDMVIQLTIQHSSIGDLVVRLSHGNTTVTLIDRPGTTTSGPGCDADLSCDSSIYLSDGGSIPIECGAGPQCDACFPSGQVPAGIFLPKQALSAFDNQDAVGPWVLSISDNAPGNVGALCRWGMSMAFQEPIASEPTAWGLVKSYYR